MRWTCRTVLSPLLTATLLAFTVSYHSPAQVLVPPGASVEVHIPAAPMPVRIGGRIHLVYELHITNFRTVDLGLRRIDVLGDGKPLAGYEDADLRAGLARAGARPDVSDKRAISNRMRVVFFVWLALGDETPVPSTLHHRISFTVVEPSGPEAGGVEAGRVAVRHDAPVVLSAPLRGGPWVAAYDPSSIGGHRRALFAINGDARIPARFAIDFIRLEGEGYGAEVLAVADGVVTAAVDGIAEPTRPLTLDNASGNYVTIDLGGGRFASYEHLMPGSISVRIGDRVRNGRVLALVGASGSVSSGPHLHFHVSDTNSPLGAEGLPFVLRSFDVLGAFESLDAVGSGKPWTRSDPVTTQRMEMPVKQTVLRF